MKPPYFFPEVTEESLKYVSLREEDIILIKRLKNTLVRSQLYAEAAILRDLEKQIMNILDAMAQHGFKPKLQDDGERVYTITEVTVMLGLATRPLKETISHYEELSRTAIVDHVAKLMKEIDELKKQIPQPEKKNEPEDFKPGY